MKLKPQKAIIIGLGSQGEAWAQNLKDSGWDITILLRPESSSFPRASQNFKTISFEKIPPGTHNFLMLTPDQSHLQILKKIDSKQCSKSRFIYAHGYSYDRHQLKEKYPQFSHLLLAPKAIASEVRFQYKIKGKLAALYSLEAAQDFNLDKKFILQLASSLGITSGPFETTFQEETFADLFSEQSLLCSLIPYGAEASYNKLREKGVQKEVAFFECWYEVKLIADAMMKLGPYQFFKMISPNAFIGGEKGRQLLINENFKNQLDLLAKDIYEKKFYEQGESVNLDLLRSQREDYWRDHELEETYQSLRSELVND